MVHDGPRPVRFRGSVVRSRSLSRGGFWNTLDATKDEIVLGRWPLRSVVLRRAEVDTVRFMKPYMPLFLGTDVTFETAGATDRLAFVPYRRARLLESLRALGWPIVEEA